MPPGIEDIVGFAVSKEHGPLALTHNQLRAQLELTRPLLRDTMGHLGPCLVDEFDEIHEGHQLPPCSGDQILSFRKTCI